MKTYEPKTSENTRNIYSISIEISPSLVNCERDYGNEFISKVQRVASSVFNKFCKKNSLNKRDFYVSFPDKYEIRYCTVNDYTKGERKEMVNIYLYCMMDGLVTIDVYLGDDYVEVREYLEDDGGYVI